MSKRNAPESGFGPSEPTKRQAPIQRNSHPLPHPQKLSNEDGFPATANDEDEFVLDPDKRQELAREAEDLQTAPDLDLDQTPHPPNTSGENEDHCDEESSADEHAAPKKASRSSNANDKGSFKFNAPQMFREPTLWKQGVPDRAAAWIARKSDALICGNTNIVLNTEPLLVNGTLWREVLLDKLPEIFQFEEALPLPPEQEKYDFLKACYRLGRLMEPTRMSRLLGGGYRTPEYCAFLLQGFLGLINNAKVRSVLLGATSKPSTEDHRDVIVYADHLYPSDDEIMPNQQAETIDLQKQTASDSGNNDVIVIEESDGEEDDGHEDPSHLHESAVPEIKLKNNSEQNFLAKPSYVLRKYMSIVTGLHLNTIEHFAAYCEKAGATFLTDPRRQSLGRLKWLDERVPAPELRPGGAISEPLDLWKHATKMFSVKSLSRCALIRVNPLLDWLGFVAKESAPATSEAEYYRLKRPVVAIAPIPLLYLADKAVNFALRVLSWAVQIQTGDCPAADKSGTSFTICSEEVKYAAQTLEQDACLGPILHTSNGSSVLGHQDSYTNSWPVLVQRPLTASVTLDLCDRTPKASISIPEDIMGEMRASLMSLRTCVIGKLYTNVKMFENKDPFAYMSAEERNDARKKRLKRNRENGIQWHRKAEEGKDDNGKGTEKDNTANPASSPNSEGFQPSSEREKHPEAQWDEDNASIAQTTVGGISDGKVRSSQGKKRTERIPSYFDQVNVAELVACGIGEEELKKRRDRTCDWNAEEEYQKSRQCAALFLKESANDQKCTTTTVCLHRLGWICLHALGIAIDKSFGDTHPMRYASCVNYTNYAEFCSENPITLTSEGLTCLAQMADNHVRQEAEILMACAAHDDGRPWIDKADVALVTGVRKENYCYADP